MTAADPLWPNPLTDAALYGLAGEIVDTIGPQSESDPAALLVQLLVAFGNVIGRRPHWKVEATRHNLNLFTVLVGNTSKGRKGTAWGQIRALIEATDPSWGECRQTGLSSGEGLIHAVRDEADIIDKRLLVVESEFASTLRVLARDGNTLSGTMRQAWDGDPLQNMTKQSGEKATDAHISIVGHICKDELRSELTRTDEGNGFANRILWVCSQRSKFLPDGGHVPDTELQCLVERLKGALEFALSLGDFELRRDDTASAYWHQIYPHLSADKPGLFGAVTSRAEAQVMRLACVYALLDQSPEVCIEHLLAAEAVWKYCEASAQFIFGDSLGNPLADELLRQLRQAPQGLTRTELSNALGRNKSAEQIGQALKLLTGQGHANAKMVQTSGRAAEHWFAVT